MSVIIKGMEMPKDCLTCYCTDSEYGECILDPEKRCPKDYKQVAEWCPLIEVPPHGRLIDVKSLENMHFTECMYDAESKLFVPFVEVASTIFDAPTIIPADKEKE